MSEKNDIIKIIKETYKPSFKMYYADNMPSDINKTLKNILKVYLKEGTDEILAFNDTAFMFHGHQGFLFGLNYFYVIDGVEIKYLCRYENVTKIEQHDKNNLHIYKKTLYADTANLIVINSFCGSQEKNLKWTLEKIIELKRKTALEKEIEYKRKNIEIEKCHNDEDKKLYDKILYLKGDLNLTQSWLSDLETALDNKDADAVIKISVLKNKIKEQNNSYQDINNAVYARLSKNNCTSQYDFEKTMREAQSLLKSNSAYFANLEENFYDLGQKNKFAKSFDRIKAEIKEYEVQLVQDKGWNIAEYTKETMRQSLRNGNIGQSLLEDLEQRQEKVNYLKSATENLKKSINVVNYSNSDIPKRKQEIASMEDSITRIEQNIQRKRDEYQQFCQKYDAELAAKNESKVSRKKFNQAVDSLKGWQKEYDKLKNTYAIGKKAITFSDYEQRRDKNFQSSANLQREKLETISQKIEQTYASCLQFEEVMSQESKGSLKNDYTDVNKKIAAAKRQIEQDVKKHNELEQEYQIVIQLREQNNQDSFDYENLLAMIIEKLQKYSEDIDNSNWGEIEEPIIEAVDNLEKELIEKQPQDIDSFNVNEYKFFKKDVEEQYKSKKKLQGKNNRLYEEARGKIKEFREKYLGERMKPIEYEFDPKKPTVYIEYCSGKVILEYKKKTLNDRDMQRMLRKPFEKWFEEDENWRGFPIELVAKRRRSFLEIVFRGSKEHFELLKKEFSEIDFKEEVSFDFDYHIVHLECD